MPEVTFARISRDACKPFILDTHYAHRWPSYSYAYGLFIGERLEGVVLFGRPSMRTVRTGLAGEDNEREVWELMRLVLKENRPGDASRLVSAGIRMLVQDLRKQDDETQGAIILSFADPAHGHHGGIYQACSFLYQGMTAKRWHWTFVRDFEEEDGTIRKAGMHCASIVGIFRGQKNRRAMLEARYGDAVAWVRRPRKHRYVRVAGSKSYRKKKTRQLRYKVEPYPKEN